MCTDLMHKSQKTTNTYVRVIIVHLNYSTTNPITMKAILLYKSSSPGTASVTYKLRTKSLIIDQQSKDLVHFYVKRMSYL